MASLRSLAIDVGFRGSKAVAGLTNVDKRADKTKATFAKLGQGAINTGRMVDTFGRNTSFAQRALTTFNHGIDTAKDKAKQFRAEIQKTGNQLKKDFKQAVEDAKPGNMFEGFRTAGTVALAGGAVGAGIIGKAVKTYADFEHSMARVGALSRASDEDLARLSKTARDLGAATSFSASQAAEGMQYLSMAGFSVNDTIAAMPGLLDMAAAAQMDLGQASDISSNILSAFSLKADEMGRVADVLTAAFTSANMDLGMLGQTMKYVGPIASSAGYSLEEMAAAAGILGDVGIQADQAGTALRATLIRLAKPPKMAADKLKELGIQVSDSEGKMRPLHDIVRQVAESTEGMGEAQKLAAVASITGTEAASAFMALIDAGPDKLAAFTKELENSGGVAKEVADKQLDSLRGSLTYLGSAVEEAFIVLGEGPAGILRKLAEGANNLVNWINNLNPKTKSMIANIGLAVTAFALLGGGLLIFASLLPSIVAGFALMKGAMLGIAFNPITLGIMAVVAAGVLLWRNWDKIKIQAGNLGKFIGGVVDGIKQKFEGLKNIAKNLLPGNWKIVEQFKNIFEKVDLSGGIRKILPRATKAMIELRTRLLGGLKKDSEETLKNIVKYLNNIPEAVKSKLGATANTVKEWAVSIPTRISNTFASLGVTISNKLTEIPSMLKETGSNLVAQIKTWFSGAGKEVGEAAVKNAAKGATGKKQELLDSLGKIIVDVAIAAITLAGVALLATGREIVKRISDGIKNLFPVALQAGVGVIQNVISGVKSLVAQMLQIGKNIVQGVVDGIKSKLGAVKQAAKDLSDAIGGKIKVFFGIKSPSKLMGEYGKNIGAGMALGIDKSLPLVKKSVSGLNALTLTAGYTPYTQTASNPSQNDILATSPTINLTVNIMSNNAEEVKREVPNIERAVKKATMSAIDEYFYQLQIKRPSITRA